LTLLAPLLAPDPISALLVLAMGLILSRLAAAFLAAILLASYEEYWENRSFTDVPKERSVLLDSIRSYSRVDEIRTLLGHLAAKWEVIEKSSEASPTDSRPPFQVYAVFAREYEHLGFRGDLKLTFFNDRLMSAVFYPRDFSGYVRRASATLPGLTEKTSVRVPPFTQVTLVTDYHQRKYVSWEDVRLTEEMSIWIKRYS